MPNFSINPNYISNPIFNPYQGFYSPLTQELANQFGSWMDIRQHSSDPGQQFLNATAIQLQDWTRSYNSALDNFYLQTCDLNQADILTQVQMPTGVQLNPTAPSTITGDSNNLFILTDINQFLYKVLPTRIGLLSTQTATTITFANELEYDISYTDVNDIEYTIYYNASSGQLQKYYYVNTLPFGPNPASPEQQIIGTYTLTDINGNPIVGTYSGATLYQDWLYILFGSNLYLFDARIPIQINTTQNFIPNQEVTSISALAQVTLAESLAGNNAIALDVENSYLWVQNGSSYYYYQIYFDYALADYIQNNIFLREQYSQVLVNNTAYPSQLFNLWNALDEFGQNELNTPRLLGENNKTYQARLLKVMQFRSNSTAQGVVNSVTLNLGLSGYYGYWASGTYPSGIYPNGNYVSGYPYYINGIYPTGIFDIAKVNALFSPAFYSTVVNSGTNIPSSSFCSYTREILQTFPLLWGSGVNDPYGFIWDLAPFDGGLNYTSITPNFFGNAYVGVSGIYFQSGVEDPNSDQLEVNLVRTSGDQWIPQINTGSFFINNNSYYMFAQAGYEQIPSGVLTYSIINSGSIIAGNPFVIVDSSGLIAPSGTEYQQVQQFDSNPYEYIVSGNQYIYFNENHDALDLFYETSNNGYYTPSGWDFNPVHTALPDGFIWISNQVQDISISGSYTFNVTPSELSFGAGGGAVGIGQLLDTNGLPIAGASAYFGLSGPGSINTTFQYTGLDGRVFTFYTPDLSISKAMTPALYSSGNSLVISGTIALSTPLDNIYTIEYLPDISGYTLPGVGQFKPVSWLSPSGTPNSIVINPTDWASGNFTPVIGSGTYGPYTGMYIIGGSGIGLAGGDNYYNIAQPSIQINNLQVPLVSGDTGLTGFASDVDNYASPLFYGKTIIYSDIIPTASVNLQFNTYNPVFPLSITNNSPFSGLVTITYPYPPISGVTYEIISPATAVISSYAIWNGVQTIAIPQTIQIGFQPQQYGVFGLDNKALDYISYFRYIGV